MRSPGDAAGAILEGLRALPPEQVPLDGALGRVLAGDVVSPLDLPPWDNSAMDGYAVRSADVAAAPGVALAVVETIPAGGVPTHALGPGQCARIFTGAPLPRGADGVIRQEDAEVTEPGRVRFTTLRDLERNVRRRGEDVRRGATVLARGTALGPAQLGVLASVASADVTVHRTPTVAYFGSGTRSPTSMSARPSSRGGRSRRPTRTRSRAICGATAPCPGTSASRGTTRRTCGPGSSRRRRRISW